MWYLIVGGILALPAIYFAIRVARFYAAIRHAVPCTHDWQPAGQSIHDDKMNVVYDHVCLKCHEIDWRARRIRIRRGIEQKGLKTRAQQAREIMERSQ